MQMASYSPACIVGVCCVLAACTSPSHRASELDPPSASQQTGPLARPQHDLSAMAIAFEKSQREFEARRKRRAQYEEDWRLKVERVGAANYPPEARGLSASVRLRVWINSDGSVDSIVIDRSSGHKAVDEAAVNIVRLASPFPAFPPDLAKDTQKLVINRTWFFGAKPGVD